MNMARRARGRPAEADRPLANEATRVAYATTRPQSPLQVRLEVLVVANLLVNLQPVPLAVGHDDLVGGWIEVHRRREAEPLQRL